MKPYFTNKLDRSLKCTCALCNSINKSVSLSVIAEQTLICIVLTVWIPFLRVHLRRSFLFGHFPNVLS